MLVNFKKPLSLLALSTCFIALCLFSACGGGTETTAEKANPLKDMVEEKQEVITSAEKITASTFTAQISNAAKQYTILTGEVPQSFSDFVIDDIIPNGSSYTLSTSSLGRNGGCIVSAKEIDCSYAFEDINVTYKWLEGGHARADITAK